jgi:hypothetical protein
MSESEQTETSRTRPVGEPAERIPGLLATEEYVEQAYFYRILSERLSQNVPLQELLAHAKEELLSTTKLPMAIDFFLSEVRHNGTMATAMARLDHYFTPFQTYVIASAEDDHGRFDMRVAVEILRKEAEFRQGTPSRPATFLFQFEVLARNRLRYESGLDAISQDPIYDTPWRNWIQTVRRQLGLVDFADMVYVRSAYFVQRSAKRAASQSALGLLPRPVGEESPALEPELEKDVEAVLFGEKEGKIALANRRKDPLFLFAALQRQLNYPAVPRPKPIDETIHRIPILEKRVERLETRLKFMEEEQRKGAIDLSKFYSHPGVEPPVNLAADPPEN